MDENLKIEAVILGFDGVIFDTDIYHFVSWKRTLNRMNIYIDPLFRFESNGLNREASLNKLIKIFKLENKITQKKRKELLDIKDQIFKKLISDFNKFDISNGIVNLLSYLKEKKIKIALSTTSTNSIQILKNTEILKYFDYIPSIEEIKRNQTSVTYKNISKYFNIKPYKMLVIENSQRNINIANSLLMRTIAIDFDDRIKNSLNKVKLVSELTPKLLDYLIAAEEYK